MNGRTHARTEVQPETNMPRQRLRSWGHKKNMLKYMLAVGNFRIALMGCDLDPFHVFRFA